MDDHKDIPSLKKIGNRSCRNLQDYFLCSNDFEYILIESCTQDINNNRDALDVQVQITQMYNYR